MIITLTAIVGSVSAQSLSVQPIEVQTGQQTELVVSLTGATAMTALQINLHLPAGLTANTGSATLGAATDGHTLSVETLDSGDLLFVVYSMDLKTFKGGELLTIPVTAGSDEVNTNGALYTVRSATAEAVSNSCNGASFSVAVSTPTPAITLDEAEDNSLTQTANNGQKADVTLTRTLQTGSYNSFAVPFGVSAEQLADVLGAGAKAKKLTATSFADGTLTMTFADAATLEAGKPYLVKVPANVENPTFRGVTVSNIATAVETGSADFVPTFGKTTIGSTGDDAKSVLFIGAANTLYNPTGLPADIKGFRAYFLLKGDAAASRSVIMDFGDGETTAVRTLDVQAASPDGDYYDLQGRKLLQAPLSKGVYIVKGNKIIKK